MNTEMWMITLVGIKFIVHLVYCSPLSPIQGLNNNFFYSPPMKHIYRFWLGATLFLVQPRHSRLQMNYYYFTFACDKNKKKPTKSLTWKEENIIELQAMHSNRKLLTIRRSAAPDKVNKLKNFLLFFFLSQPQIFFLSLSLHPTTTKPTTNHCQPFFYKQHPHTSKSLNFVYSLSKLYNLNKVTKCNNHTSFF